MFVVIYFVKLVNKNINFTMTKGKSVNIHFAK